MREPILITGCARSGTSMTAGVVNICGGWGGQMSGPTPNNKKGMFENAVIRDAMIKPALNTEKCDPKGQKPLPSLHCFDHYNEETWRTRVVEFMKNQGLTEDKIWFYKGAKMCLMWPLWNRAFPKATWIIVRRNDDDIVNSCMKTGFMNAYSYPGGWHTWVKAHKNRFREMITANLNVHQIWPQKMISGDYREIEALINKTGLTWKEQQVKEFISPTLWHEKKEEVVNG